MSGSKLLPSGEKHWRSNSGESWLVGVDEAHPVRGRVTAENAGLAGRQRLQLRQEFAIDIGRDIRKALRIGVEGGMDVEACSSTRARRAALVERRIGVGRVDDMRQIAAE